MLVSVLIPVFSESKSLVRTVELIRDALDGIAYEILFVVHRESTAECLQTCEALARDADHIRFQLQQRYPGQGWAYREGFDAARGTHFLMMNADLETNPRDTRRLVDAMVERQLELVVASRWMKGGSVDVASYGPLRVVCSDLFQRLIGAFLDTPATDLTFAFKIGTRELFRSFEWEGTGHELALETTLRPLLAGRRVGEIPTTWIGRTEGVSHHAYWRNLRHLTLAARLIGRRALGRHG